MIDRRSASDFAGEHGLAVDPNLEVVVTSKTELHFQLVPRRKLCRRTGK